jgi:hypothetical protein
MTEWLDDGIFHLEINNNSDTESETEYNKLCYYCNKELVIPPNEIDNFINKHMYKKKKSLYVILVFRLCPSLLPWYFVMNNPTLRKIIFDFLNIKDDNINDYLLYQYYISVINKNITSFVYNIYFNQLKLNYEDHIKCSLCNNYICPMHIYLSNIRYFKCKYCHKKWILCGWCKPLFNEYYACEYIHK